MSVFALTAGVARAAESLSARKVLMHAAEHRRHAKKQRHLNSRLIHRLRAETWRWQALMGRARTDRSATPSTKAVLRFWVRAAGRAYVQAIHPPHKGAWLCIHRYEGSWRDSGDPYWGGLQMDRGFQQSYGGWLYRTKGTADHWSPLEQIWTAEKALKSRGFWPWPNTARYCGLL